MRIVAIDANLALGRPATAIPVPTRATMGAGFPIAEGWAVTTAAEQRAFLQPKLMFVACLQLHEVLLVVAIEAVVVAIVPAMGHYHIRMFLGDDEVLISVEAKRRRLALFMATIAIEVGQVCLHLNKLQIGRPDSCRGN